MQKKHLFIILLALFPVVFSLGQQDNAKLKKKALKIHDKILSIDTHTDTPLRLTNPDFNIGARNDPDKTHTKVDFPRMKEGRLDAVFFAVFLSQKERTPKGYEKAKQRALLLFNLIHEQVGRNSEQAQIALSADDAYKIKKTGKRSVYIGIENGYAIGKDTALLSKYYDLGARYITLCHSKDNDICGSSTDTSQFGVSDFGETVIKKMNRMGYIIDVSHISDSALYDVLEISEAPVIASHSCVRSICSHPRNLSDSMLIALAEHKGVIQICFLADYLRYSPPNPEKEKALDSLRKKYNYFKDLTPEKRSQASREWAAINDRYNTNPAAVEDIVDHIDYVKNLVGIDYVGIGTDFDGGGAVKGCYDVSGMYKITMELLRRGYSKKDIEKIWGGNFMRVFRAVEEYAGQ